MEDISEGQTSFVAEVWVAHQFLEKGLSDRLSGADPEPLRSSVPRHHLTVHILGVLPVKSRQKQQSKYCWYLCNFMYAIGCSHGPLVKGNAEFCYLKYIRENSFRVAGANRSTVPVSFWLAMTFFLWFGDKVSSLCNKQTCKNLTLLILSPL